MDNDPVVAALQDGRILFEGGASIALDASVRDAELALGIDPRRPWKGWGREGEPQGEAWRVDRGWLWFGKGRHPVELEFVDDRLRLVSGPDDAWTFAGEAFSAEEAAHEIRQYGEARERLATRLGPPYRELPGDDMVKVAVWRFRGAALTLRWESKSPSLLVSVDRRGPPAGVFPTS